MGVKLEGWAEKRILDGQMTVWSLWTHGDITDEHCEDLTLIHVPCVFAVSLDYGLETQKARMFKLWQVTQAHHRLIEQILLITTSAPFLQYSKTPRVLTSKTSSCSMSYVMCLCIYYRPNVQLSFVTKPEVSLDSVYTNSMTWQNRRSLSKDSCRIPFGPLQYLPQIIIKNMGLALTHGLPDILFLHDVRNVE